HKGAGNEQNQVHDEQDDDGVIGDAQQHRGNRLGDLQEGHNPAQDVGHANEEQHHAAHFGALHHNIPEGLPGDVAVADDQNQRVDHGNGGALCGAEHTGHNTANDHHDQRQGGQRLQGGLAQGGPAELAGGAFVALFLGQDNRHHHAA